MTAKQYKVTRRPAGTAPEAIDWKNVPMARIDTYYWLDGHTPEAAAQLVFVEDFGFVLRMTCEEASPKAVCLHYNDPVYTDSCLEFFCDWLGDGRYVNMEMNPLGTLLSCIGPDRHDRTPITAYTDGAIFTVKGEHTPTAWSVTAQIPLALLEKLLGVTSLPFGKGYTFRGNFYKCGDETPIPHFGMWSPVNTEKPDFHRPEYFGTLVMD